jgi:glycosyltransferase involved in cell wall biosynthesis
MAIISADSSPAGPVEALKQKTANRVRVLFLSRSSSDGGAERHSLEIIKRLDYGLVKLTILCFEKDYFTKRLSERARESVRVVFADSPAPHSLNKLYPHWLELKRYRPDVIVIVNGGPDAFSWHTYLAAKMTTAKRVVSIEHLVAADPPGHPKGNTSILKRLMGWRARYMYIWKRRLKGILADKTICVSQAVSDHLVTFYHYPKGKVVTIRNGVDLKSFGKAEDKSSLLGKCCMTGEREVLIVCVARLTRQKRIDLLLDALSAIRNGAVPWRCLVLGGGPLEMVLREKSAGLSLDNRVFFLGQVEDPRPHLQAADLFVLTSEKEGLPLALLEAMACGLPCIVTDVGGNREVITNGENGFLIPFGDHRHFAHQLEELIADPVQRRVVGEKANETVRKLHDLEACVDRIIKEIVPRFTKTRSNIDGPPEDAICRASKTK